MSKHLFWWFPNPKSISELKHIDEGLITYIQNLIWRIKIPAKQKTKMITYFTYMIYISIVGFWSYQKPENFHSKMFELWAQAHSPQPYWKPEKFFCKADKPQLAQAIAEYSSNKSRKVVIDFIPSTELYGLEGGSLIHCLPWKKRW